MKIKINGKEEAFSKEDTLQNLIEGMGLLPARIVIEYNREIVLRDRWPQIVLKEGDTVEIVSFVGGG